MWIGHVEATVSPCVASTFDPAVGSSACADAGLRMEIASALRYVHFFCTLTQVVREPFRPKGIKNESFVVFLLSSTADIKSDGFRLTRALMRL